MHLDLIALTNSDPVIPNELEINEILGLNIRDDLSKRLLSILTNDILKI